MNRKKQIISVIFLLIMVQSPLVSADKKQKEKSPPPAEEAAVAAVPAPVVPPVEEGPFSDQTELMQLISEDGSGAETPFVAEWGARDPFGVLPPAPKPAVPVSSKGPNNAKDSNFVLMGILWGGARPNVIINDEVYGIGGVVQGKTVEEIKEGYVVLTDGTNQTVLRLRN